MKIETKYSIGDAVFVMHNNKVVPIKIIGVHYSLDIWKGEHISYVGDITPVDSRFVEIIISYGRNEFIKEWKSVHSAAKELGLSQGNISSCLLGLRNKCGNFKWKYNENKV